MLYASTNDLCRSIIHSNQDVIASRLVDGFYAYPWGSFTFTCDDEIRYDSCV